MVSSETIHLAGVTVELGCIIFLHEVWQRGAAQEMGDERPAHYWHRPLTGHFYFTSHPHISMITSVMIVLAWKTSK